MSSCRMCDNCGTVFSERAKGWSRGSITVMQEDERTGEPKPVTLDVDKCPECTEGAMSPPPRPMLRDGVDTRPQYVTPSSHTRHSLDRGIPDL